ncbi:YqaJ viral recombinase family protein [Pseudomonas agarici]|uniref:YqaJ viral recombinase family protein n=1 Tax=Pseudomonas agarici TaxID=46677 RepID=UPI00030A8D13|nr:YqaJ viral recombinase family protein [Pseudomonas agarici]NWC11895.1 YqaJ viral recombinase family protein [Pseudomonas agarici]SEL88273.1 putative phage-type endonuclease [Pseudomonas agarici]
MKIHNVAQGSAEWLALRAKFRTASEAPAMMGASKYQTRTDLLAAKKTGITPDVTPSQQFIFDKGHATEALARPLTEALIGEELYPIVATEGNLLASMDGATMLGETLFEHKLWNESVVAQVKAGDLAPHYYWQLEQQLLVSGAERVIFVCSDGTPENFVHMEYRPVAGRAAQLIEGWKQFDADLEVFEPQATVIEVVAATIETLPTLSVQLEGAVKSSNLPAFKATVMARIQAINTDLQTDQHFADAEEMVKFCDKAEKNIDVVKVNALAQTASIDELFRTLDTIQEELRKKRLMLDKLVKARKISIRDDIVMDAKKSLQAHVDQINASLGGNARIQAIPADFAGAIKGKKTISSLRDAANSELARSKIAASQSGDSIRVNLNSLTELAADYMFLFNDVQQLALKANDDLVLLINARISEHQKAEEVRAEAQRELIRKQELERIAAEQEAERLAAIKPEPVVEKVATPEPVRTALVKAAPVGQATKPVASHTVEQVALQASVTDFEALVKAVAYGQAPITVLLVNWEALDAMVAEQGSTFSMAGVTLAKAAA